MEQFTEIQARQSAEHPWDQELQKHVCSEHGHTIRKILRPHFDDTATDDRIWAVYTEAVSVQERKKYPQVGPSIDRTAIVKASSTYNDDCVHAYMCFTCASIKVDTGRIRSDIERVTGAWLLGLKNNAAAKNLSMHRFKEIYARDKTPLHVRGGKDKADIDPPDFSDWRLELCDDVLSKMPMDDSERASEVEVQATADELRRDGLLCCPEDHTCRNGCHRRCTFCPQCVVPVCRACILCLGKGRKIPTGLANDNFHGYLPSWIYEVGVTWMEKTVAAPFWTGLTVFTIGAKGSPGQERRPKRRHLMTEPVFQNQAPQQHRIAHTTA